MDRDPSKKGSPWDYSDCGGALWHLSDLMAGKFYHWKGRIGGDPGLAGIDEKQKRE